MKYVSMCLNMYHVSIQILHVVIYFLGQTFAMSFTTLHKKDWRLILEGSETCEAALEKFPQFAKVETIGNWTKEMYGRYGYKIYIRFLKIILTIFSNWESDQNIVTAQLIRHKICTLPPGHNVSLTLMDTIVGLINSYCDLCLFSTDFPIILSRRKYQFVHRI